MTCPAVVKRTSSGSSSNSTLPEPSMSKSLYSPLTGTVRSTVRPETSPLSTPLEESVRVVKIRFRALSISIMPSCVTTRCNTRSPEPPIVKSISPARRTTASRVPISKFASVTASLTVRFRRSATSALPTDCSTVVPAFRATTAP